MSPINVLRIRPRLVRRLTASWAADSVQLAHLATLLIDTGRGLTRQHASNLFTCVTFEHRMRSPLLGTIESRPVCLCRTRVCGLVVIAFADGQLISANVYLLSVSRPDPKFVRAYDKHAQQAHRQAAENKYQKGRCRNRLLCRRIILVIVAHSSARPDRRQLAVRHRGSTAGGTGGPVRLCNMDGLNGDDSRRRYDNNNQPFRFDEQICRDAQPRRWCVRRFVLTDERRHRTDEVVHTAGVPGTHQKGEKVRAAMACG